MPLISGAIQAGLNYDAQMKTNEQNYKMMQEQNAFNSAEAEKQRNWEKEMSDTEMQRRMADLQAAGVNPLLAIDGAGSGATSGSGSAASGSAAHLQAPKLDLNSVTAGLSNMAAGAVALAKLKALGNAKDLASIVKVATSAKKASTLAGIVASIL